MKAPDVTGRIARFVAETPADEIPASVRSAAVNTIIDTYATAVAGTVEPVSGVIRKPALEWAGRGESRVLGEPNARVDPATATLVNGSAAHALDYDVVSVAVSGFIGSAMAVALTAWVENSEPRSGRDVLTAYALGWEGASAIARGVNIWHYAHGWHPTATISHFAAALACGRLASLDEQQMRMALGVAVSEASGVKTMIGNMLNPFHVGKAARNGVNAVHMVMNGFEAHPNALESDQGFLNVFNGERNYDIDVILETPGVVWDLDSEGPIFKVYPCCALIHSGIDAALALREEHGLKAEEIRSVTVKVHEYVPRVMHVDVPDHGYAAKFSIPYCIAAAVHGRVDLATFDSVDPQVIELGRRVRHEVHPKLRGEDAFLRKEFTELEVVTDRGTFKKHVDRMANRGTGRHFNEGDLRAKLVDCIRHSRMELDATAEWSRLKQMDSDRAWNLWGNA
jgi:2-methylcitrate dehydratase PrpD